MEHQLPLFSSVVLRNHFEAIFWQLHISNTPEMQPVRRVNKVKFFLDLLLQCFQANYTPGQEVVIDETMFGF